MGIDITNQCIIVSALMHDIGKFAQRAEQKSSRQLESAYCPVYNGTTTHKHVLYTDFFIESADFPLPHELQEHRSRIARLAAVHHNPGVSNENSEKLLEEIIQKADCFSSGLDRLSSEEENNYKKTRLESIFSFIELREPNTQKKYHVLQKQGEAKALFPCSEKENKTGDYEKLFADFVNTLKKIPLDQGFQAYLSSLVSVLEQYTYCIPSSTYKSDPDISLYDHSITTAAIAQALWACCEENRNIPLGKQSFLLFSAEFSGIQKYIFSGKTSTGTAKILRARSFHLQALTRSIILHTLDTLSLSPVAKIMDAGGKFILLLPDTPRTKVLMREIMQEIEIFFAQTFKGELKAPLALLPVTQAEMKQERFLEKLDVLNDELETNKFKAFQHYFAEYPAVFDIEYNKGICSYCERNRTEDEDLCSECKNLIEIGEAIPKSTLGLFTKNKPPKNYAFFKLIGGISLVLDNGGTFAKSDIEQALDCINLKSFGSYTRYPIAGYIPRKEKRPKDFEELADSAVIHEENRCVSMLGILKADVDNLGFIFSLGFKNRLSVSRYAQLSRMLNAFFSEYLVQVIEENNFNIYTVFMGGDDLLVLGAWTDILAFAKILHTDFSAFTAENKDITLSAGIAFVKPKLPVSKFAAMAEEALEQSKTYQKNGQMKNACTLFEVTCPWTEFDKQCKTGKDLEDALLQNKLTQGFVRRLLSYADDCKLFMAEGKIRHGLYVSHLQYDMARNISDEDVKKQIAKITQAEEFENSRIAISYALYKTRNA